MNSNFSFPFEPYDIQVKFMTELYSTIESKKLGIFESPTGTGKSLSICCGSLQWLRDTNKKIEEDLIKNIEDLKYQIANTTGSDDWLQDEYNKIQKNQLLLQLQNKLSRIKKMQEEFQELKNKVAKQNAQSNKIDSFFIKQNKVEKSDINEENLVDDDLIVEIENNEDDSDDEPPLEDVEDSFTKIYISSRTHSQLSQFIGEIKRTIFNRGTKVVTLASRQHYCINSEVNRLKNVSLINERCLEMQKSKTKSTAKDDEGKVVKKSKTKACSACPYYNQNNIKRLKEKVLVEVMDMEEIVKSGKQMKACPYYASRMALEDAEVALISHAGIVSHGARTGVSIKLQNNILIMDEAHGLSAALENAHSAPVSHKQLSCVKTFLEFYINKYRSLLSSKNLLQLNQINFVVGKLIGMVRPKLNDKDGSKIYTLEDFVIEAEIDHLHLHPLVEFCRNVRLAPKLHGFSMRYSQQTLEDENKKDTNKKGSFKDFLSSISKKKTQNDSLKCVPLDVPKSNGNTNLEASPSEISAGSSLYAILDFLERLCDRSENGRVLTQSDSGLLKYLLLNPAEHFADVVSQCRSVILAGGTMEPISEFQALLACDKTQLDRVNVVKCGHVVPADNVLGICLSKGPSKLNLNFSYENRSSFELLNEIGRILRNVCNVVPDGVVCFLPSYSFQQTLYEHLNSTGVLESVSKKKIIFREPKSASEVEQVLQKYSAAVKNKVDDINGALMLSVVGGKLSEGLNFSDELGRCVLVVGMPYPNIKSLELQEKMKYLNKSTPGSGSVYYENLCMKAVNQCIGRAVRHANDYACVILVDERYSRSQTIAALPSFVQKSLISDCTFGQAMGSIAKFFARHKTKNNANK
ncbi:unnamed protein product [Danaus chrysippus]|uniref:(African queen) hypothetical protein n=1 Tax=Danaus chrysippus TaxID=151541 RepID=A0A8J2VW04_9NEOP|nr:unnamed protein product [Danaus chrysippus]